MPNYHNACLGCGFEFDVWQSIHDPDRPDCPKCTSATVRVISEVNTYAVGERGRHTAISDSTDKVWHKDMAAYADFRKQGLQPQRITGCDRLEATAKGTYHVETGQAYTDAQVSSGRERARQILREA